MLGIPWGPEKARTPHSHCWGWLNLIERLRSCKVSGMTKRKKLCLYCRLWITLKSITKWALCPKEVHTLIKILLLPENANHHLSLSTWVIFVFRRLLTHHNRYNNEKVWNAGKITKMWWDRVSKFTENGTDQPTSFDARIQTSNS